MLYMAGGQMKLVSRARYVPKRRKRSRRGKKKTIASVVKRVLHSQTENKQAFMAVSGIRVAGNFPASIAAGMYPIIPPVVSALSSDNSKIGQQIKPLSLRLGMTAYLNTIGGNTNSRMYFDLYVFSIKKLDDVNLFDSAGPAEINKFFRPGLSANDTTYEGRCYDFHKNVNRGVITLHHKKRFKMSPTNLSATSNQDGSWDDNYGNVAINYTLPLTKHIKKTLRYTSTTDETPNNCALFATLVVTKADATIVGDPSFVAGTCTFNSTMVYEDA